MSLEQVIKDNTAALIANTAAITALSITTHNATLEKPAIQPAAQPKPAAPQPQAPAGAPAIPKLTYEAVAKVVSDFVRANGRKPAELLLKPFNVPTLVPLKDKPAELVDAFAAFTDPVKTAAAIAAARAAA